MLKPSSRPREAPVSFQKALACGGGSGPGLQQWGRAPSLDREEGDDFGGQGLLGRRAWLWPLVLLTTHLSGNSTKKVAFRKRPKLQSVATSQWDRKPGSVLTTHLRTSVWRERGDS